jgi:two-component system chemotaxis response regulator CheY
MATMLVVDDSSYMRTLVKTFVSKLDIKIIGEAEDGREGLNKYKELMPDIVVLDLAMDEMDGIEVLKEIMALNPGAVVIIISSTAGQEPVIIEALKLGARNVFDKPINKDKFIDCIKSLLGEKQN